MKNKKAVSDIVSTVLIIMLVVAAIGIMGTIIVPMVRDTLQGGTACLNAVKDVLLVTETGHTCKTESGNVTNISVQVRKGSDGTVKLGALDILVMGADGNSKTYTLEEDEGMPGIGETRRYIIQVKKSIVADPVSVNLAPVVEVGNTLKRCDASIKDVPLVACRN
jgi:hypothetical protein